MKTSLTCLAILIVSLVLGKIQGARLEKLKQRNPSSVVHRSRAYERASTDDTPAYRSKYQRTSKHADAKDVLQSMIKLLDGRKSTQTGDMASMTDRNKDALKAVLQLDPSGLKELVTLISQSKDPNLTMNSSVKYEQITLCIIALADQDPGDAFDYVMNAEKEFDPKVFRAHGTSNWLQYLLTRLGDLEPQRALDELVKLADDPTEPWSDEAVRGMLAKVVRQDPGLVLETIDRLPTTKSRYFLEILTFQMESDDERTALFLALRDHFHIQPELIKAGLASLNLDSLTDQLESSDRSSELLQSLRTHFHLEPEMVKSGVASLKLMKVGLASLFGRFRDGRESPAEIRKWADSLGMSDTEKFLICDSLSNIDINEQNSEEYARWFATFLPPSEVRKSLVWKAANYWGPKDRSKAMEFLKEQGIDPQEMIRRD
jgi:aryl carrier-like protein